MIIGAAGRFFSSLRSFVHGKLDSDAHTPPFLWWTHLDDESYSALLMQRHILLPFMHFLKLNMQTFTPHPFATCTDVCSIVDLKFRVPWYVVLSRSSSALTWWIDTFKDKHMSKLISIDEDETVRLMTFQIWLASSLFEWDHSWCISKKYRWYINFVLSPCKSYIRTQHHSPFLWWFILFITTVNVATALTTTACDRA